MVIPFNYQWMRVVLLAGLLITLPSSSFFLKKHLTAQITTQKHSTRQLDFALKQHNETALNFAWQQSKKHSPLWLLLAKKLANTQGQAAYQLALFYQAQQLIPEAITWYQQGMRLKFPPAFLGLAQYYFEQGNFSHTSNVLAELVLKSTSTIEAQVLEVKLAIVQGKLAIVKQKLAEFSSRFQENAQGRLLLEQIHKYQVLTVNDNSKNTPVCSRSIQLFATRFSHLQRLESLIKDFEQHSLKAYVCFNPVRYIAIDSLACTASSGESIQCNEENWLQLAASINSRFVGLLLPEGGANVHFGVLYLDAHDTFDVFVHEVSHLLGFVDEYPLPQEHRACTSIQRQAFSENVAVLANRYQGKQSDIRAKVISQLAWGQYIKESTPLLQPVTEHGIPPLTQWFLGTPKTHKHEIGVFKGHTCDNAVYDSLGNNNNFSAYSPLLEPTKMQYFSLDFPSEYLEFLHEGKMSFLMPSFHYNIALALFTLGDVAQAKYWLNQSAKWEIEVERREKSLQGNF